jgi:hypothetical protein
MHSMGDPLAKRGGFCIFRVKATGLLSSMSLAKAAMSLSLIVREREAVSPI